MDILICTFMINVATQHSPSSGEVQYQRLGMSDVDLWLSTESWPYLHSLGVSHTRLNPPWQVKCIFMRHEGMFVLVQLKQSDAKNHKCSLRAGKQAMLPANLHLITHLLLYPLFPPHESLLKLFLESRQSFLPVSCDQWRCPCWMGLALHTRRRCCCGSTGWLRGHRWTEMTRCWAESGATSPAARRAPMFVSPSADDTTPGDYRRRRWWRSG